MACSIVREELLFGAYRTKNASRSIADVNQFLAGFASLPFNDATADISARIRANLEAAGERIDVNDVLIASIALANGLILVTHNVRHLSRVPGLSIEDWESAP